MTNLNKLSVSLTKHGAYKIAPLLMKFGADEVMKHLSGSVDGINIEEAQAKKNLSVDSKGRVPKLWNEARQLGPEAVRALTLIGVIFSHHTLIDAMVAGSSGKYSGTVRRDQVIGGKEYTNFSCNIDELGFATSVSLNGVSYDLHQMFAIPGLGRLAAELISLKLKTAGWTQSNTLAEEFSRLNLHKVFAAEESVVKEWLVTSASTAGDASMIPKDSKFFSESAAEEEDKGFTFTPGHVARATSPLERSASARSKALRLHNEIQNQLYEFLAKVLGKDNVGTEIDTGTGTQVDVVSKEAGALTFYEIKTASSVKACIRQAIPQLLEYCYWSDAERAKTLVIVSHLPITKESRKYLRCLRERFKLPIHYRQFCMTKKELLPA